MLKSLKFQAPNSNLIPEIPFDSAQGDNRWKYKVPGTKFNVLSTKFQAPNSTLIPERPFDSAQGDNRWKYKVPGTKHQIPSSLLNSKYLNYKLQTTNR